MKKLLILALVVLVAGSAFATTEPAFGGTFEFFTYWNFDEKTQTLDSTEDASINLNGIVDEWSTVNAEIGHSTVDWTERVLSVTKGAGNVAATVEIGDTILTDLDSYDIEDTGDTGYGGVIADMIDSQNAANVYDTYDADAMTLNQFTMTTDVTGALGIDGPVGVSVTWGKTDLKAAEYQGVAGYEDVEVANPTDAYLGVKLAITIIEKIKLITAIYPSTYTSLEWGGASQSVFGMDLQFAGLIEGLNFNVFYLMDPNYDNDDDTGITEETDEFGFTAGYVMGGLSIGAALKYDMFLEVLPFGVSAAYATDFGLTAGVAYSCSNGTEDFGDNSAVGLNATYAVVADVLDVYVGVKIPFLELSDNFGMDVGMKTYLGGVTYILGYEYRNVNFVAPDGDDSYDALYFTVKASF